MSTPEEADAFIESMGCFSESWDPDDPDAEAHLDTDPEFAAEIERIAMAAFRQLDKAGKLMEIQKEATTLVFVAISGAVGCAIVEAVAMAIARKNADVPWKPVNIAKAAVVGAVSAPVQRTGVRVLRSTLRLPERYSVKR